MAIRRADDYLTGMAASPSVPVFSALGQATRLRAFELLLARGAGGMLQGELARSMGVDKNLMSAHLKVLRDADLVTSERNGREVVYRVSPIPARTAAAALLATISRAEQTMRDDPDGEDQPVVLLRPESDRPREHRAVGTRDPARRTRKARQPT